MRSALATTACALALVFTGGAGAATPQSRLWAVWLDIQLVGIDRDPPPNTLILYTRSRPGGIWELEDDAGGRVQVWRVIPPKLTREGAGPSIRRSDSGSLSDSPGAADGL